MLLSVEEYLRFCKKSPDANVERTAEGEVVVVPLPGGEASFRETEVDGPLWVWARAHGRGRALNASVQFLLPSGAALSPDAAWVSKERLATLTRKQRTEFLRVVPEFVVEVMSPSDRLRNAQRKMQTWMANGVQLGWLIHGDERTVYVYRQNADVEARQHVNEIAGEGAVAGFLLELTELWEGL